MILEEHCLFDLGFSLLHSFDVHYRQKLCVICFIRQIVACILPKLTVMTLSSDQ